MKNIHIRYDLYLDLARPAPLPGYKPPQKTEAEAKAFELFLQRLDQRIEEILMMKKFDEAFDELVAACEQPGDNLERRLEAEEALLREYGHLPEDGRAVALKNVADALFEVMFMAARSKNGGGE